MTTEGSAMYSAALMTPTAISQPAVSAAEPAASSPVATPATAAPGSAAAAAAAAVAAAAAQTQTQTPVPAQTTVDKASPTIATPAVPQPAPPAMQPMAAAAAAAAFSQYPAGMVFAAPDAAAAVLEDQPTYVNPKQYARILKRRESRKKQTGTDVTSYTPRKRSYMHESRHKHAMQRRRGPGGRFLSKEEREDLARQQMKEQAAAGQ